MKRFPDMRPLAPGRLYAAGTAGWLFTGLVAAFAIVLFVLLVLRPLLLPLVVAAALATVAAPLVNVLTARRIPRSIVALLVCLLVVGLAVVSIAVFIAGLAGQWNEISGTFGKAVDRLAEIADDVGLGQQQVTEVQQTIAKAAPSILTGLVSGLAGGALAAVQLVLGSALGLYMLFFLLKDAGPVQAVVVRALPLPPPLGYEASARAANLVRRYFGGMALIGLANTVLVVVGALILDVPLVGSIALVTFLMAFVPYIGAFASGAFAVLIALGAGGTGTAAWMLLVVLLANVTLQNLLEPFAFGAALRMHPLVVLLATLLAGLFAGVAGVIMAAPLMAIALDTARLLRHQPSEAASLDAREPATEEAGR